MTDSLFGDLYNPDLATDAAEMFDRANVPAQKQVASTSIEAYRTLGSSLPAREQAVLIGLRRFWASRRFFPTSYELFAAMQAEGAAFDLNSVRPRITALFNKGALTREAKRVCHVTGKRAYTWAIQDNQEG